MTEPCASVTGWPMKSGNGRPMSWACGRAIPAYAADLENLLAQLDAEQPAPDAMAEADETQAPERLHLQGFGGVIMGYDHLRDKPDDYAWEGHYIRADLAAAQAAAAVEHAFRDGLTYATNCHLFKRAQFDQAWAQSKARERLGDASAALDALIAEARREAFEQLAQIVDCYDDDDAAYVIRARASKEVQS